VIETDGWYMTGAHTSVSYSMNECLPEVKGLVSLFVSQYMYDVR